MNDQPGHPDPTGDPPTQPLQPQPEAPPVAQPEHRVLPPDPALHGEGSPPPKQRFVDRLWSLRAVIAVALASVIIGGLGGGALASAGEDQDARPGPGHRFHPGRQMPPPGMQRWRDGQGNGQDNRGPGMMPGQPGAPTPTPVSPTPTR
jgi:hypothetical protein